MQEKYLLLHIVHIQNLFLLLARFHFNWLPGFLNHLLWRFIHANHWKINTVRPFINIQYLFHVCYKMTVLMWWNNPSHYVPGLQFVFFRTRLIVSLKYCQHTPFLPSCQLIISKTILKNLLVLYCNLEQSNGLPNLHLLS
jgi:hypothetical protein